MDIEKTTTEQLHVEVLDSLLSLPEELYAGSGSDTKADLIEMARNLERWREALEELRCRDTPDLRQVRVFESRYEGARDLFASWAIDWLLTQGR